MAPIGTMNGCVLCEYYVSSCKVRHGSNWTAFMALVQQTPVAAKSEQLWLKRSPFHFDVIASQPFCSKTPNPSKFFLPQFALLFSAFIASTNNSRQYRGSI